MDLGITLDAWARAFAFTQIVEVPIYVFFLSGRFRVGRAFGASLITHPILWWVIPPLWPFGYWSYVIAGETFVVLTEAVYLRLTGYKEPWLSRKSPLLLSLCANAASAGLGMATRALFGWP